MNQPSQGGHQSEGNERSNDSKAGSHDIDQPQKDNGQLGCPS
jgi:hypothetical protein